LKKRSKKLLLLGAVASLCQRPQDQKFLLLFFKKEALSFSLLRYNSLWPIDELVAMSSPSKAARVPLH
jgi:hypothetical protein